MTTMLEKKRRQLPWPVEFYRSAVGKKWVMAITGIVLIIYLIAHLVGNAKAWMGPENGVPALDVYGASLRELLYPIFPKHVPLWILRIGLIVSFVFHIHAAAALTIMNRRARPVDYRGPRDYLVANYASRTMRWSGVIVLLYVLWHLADFTWGVQPAAPDGWVHGAILNNFILTFQRPLVAIWYIVAMIAVGIHIYHGAWSMFQSLGVNHPRFNPWRRWFAIGLAAVLTAGNIALPVSVMLGFRGIS